jgi:hypothetical protein
LFGPATHYPSTIEVAGVAGAVTKVTATVLDFGSSSPDDIDMALVGPNGAQVMLMSNLRFARTSGVPPLVQLSRRAAEKLGDDVARLIGLRGPGLWDPLCSPALSASMYRD